MQDPRGLNFLRNNRRNQISFRMEELADLLATVRFTCLLLARSDVQEEHHRDKNGRAHV